MQVKSYAKLYAKKYVLNVCALVCNVSSYSSEDLDQGPHPVAYDLGAR